MERAKFGRIARTALEIGAPVFAGVSGANAAYEANFHADLQRLLSGGHSIAYAAGEPCPVAVGVDNKSNETVRVKIVKGNNPNGTTVLFDGVVPAHNKPEDTQKRYPNETSNTSINNSKPGFEATAVIPPTANSPIGRNITLSWLCSGGKYFRVEDPASGPNISWPTFSGLKLDLGSFGDRAKRALDTTDFDDFAKWTLIFGNLTWGLRRVFTGKRTGMLHGSMLGAVETVAWKLLTS